MPPPTDPLVRASDMRYDGSFKLPVISPPAGLPYDTFAYGGSGIGFNVANNSLYMVGHPYGQRLAEISIPTPINSTSLAALNTATVLQTFKDPFEGKQLDVGGPGGISFNIIGGVLVDGANLIISDFIYYDAGFKAKSSHFKRPANLSTTGQVTGPYKVGPKLPGYVAGYMAYIPTAWRTDLGGPALTGQSNIAILSRTNNGPGVSVFDPASLTGAAQTTTAATEVLGYPISDLVQHNLGWDTGLGCYTCTSSLFNGSSRTGGVVFPGSSNSVLFIGSQGTGTYGYGAGGAVNPNNGEAWFYDPVLTGKGNHAYPYRNQVWAYDAAQLLRVKNGEINPYDVKPYEVWPLTLPFTAGHKLLGSEYGGGGVASDPATNRIFISSTLANGTLPVVHVFTVTLAGTEPPPPPPACVYTLSKTSADVTYLLTTNNAVDVATAIGCAWTGVSNVAWLVVTAGATGSGSGRVSFTILANPITSPRSGTLTIAAQTVTVNQAAAPAVPEEADQVNPDTLVFNASSDHDGLIGKVPKVDGYAVIVYTKGTSQIVSRHNLGKPTPSAGVITVATTAFAGFIKVLPPGEYDLKVGTISTGSHALIESAAVLLVVQKVPVDPPDGVVLS